jgi:hypothetical protein
MISHRKAYFFGALYQPCTMEVRRLDFPRMIPMPESRVNAYPEAPIA